MIAIIKDFFTKQITIIEIYYAVLLVSSIGGLIFGFFPTEKALKMYRPYLGHSSKKREYDWEKTLRRQAVFLGLVFIYSLIGLVLSYIFGRRLAEIGMLVLAILVLIGSFYLDPIKKEEKSDLY